MSDAQTSRTLFNETWLMEMPRGIGSFELFDMIEYNINDLKQHNNRITSLGNNFFKVDLSTSVYYWYETGGQILLGVELEKLPHGWVIRATGKNLKARGKKPWASDLYDAVLKDSGKSIRIISDSDLSDEGYTIWKRLYQLGHQISVYDQADPGKTFKAFNSEAEFEKYFKDDEAAYKRYQFVLSESSGISLTETKINFRLRRYHELINSTDDWKTK